ncbi:hypothetical protein FACS1894214_2740 [Planctomycetales bacterium]|nr:hypothetical protein FACS1894214_2740 [Planctomycetales bacterium]
MGAGGMDPAMMAGGDPAAMGMPMDPAMAGGMPPMDPAMAGAMPPSAPMDMPQGTPMMVDPATGGMPVDPAAAMPPDPAAEEEGIRQIIRDEIQKAMGTGDAGQPAGAAPVGKKSNKLDDAIATLKEQNEQQTKLLVAALRQAGVEIPLADMMGIDGSMQGKQEPGLSESINPGQSGNTDGGQAAKIGEFNQSVDNLVKLANIRNKMNQSALGKSFTPFNPTIADTEYLMGLWR